VNLSSLTIRYTCKTFEEANLLKLLLLGKSDFFLHWSQQILIKDMNLKSRSTLGTQQKKINQALRYFPTAKCSIFNVTG